MASKTHEEVSMQADEPSPQSCETGGSGVDENALVRRAMDGDRVAFDALFDRYYGRLAHQLRELSPAEARRAIRVAMRQLFTGLERNEVSLVQKAFRIGREARAGSLSRRRTTR
jgi:hypothetical protein